MQGLVDDDMFEISIESDDAMDTCQQKSPGKTNKINEFTDQELVKAIESNNALINELQREIKYKTMRIERLKGEEEPKLQEV